jgi:hypothetical protein
MGYLNTFLIKRAFASIDHMTKDAGPDYATWNPQSTYKVENMVMRSHGLNPAQAKQYVQSAFIDKGFTPNDARGYTQQMHLERTGHPAGAPRPAAPAPAPANAPVNYARRTWNSAKDLGRNAMGMGKQGFNAVKTMARRNPKMAALMAIGGTLFGGSLMAGAANSGRPPVRQSNANNPYAGLETYA